MAGTNDFKAIATGVGANVITQSAFAALSSFLANGYSSGVVASDQFNKIIRQSSFISAVVGQIVANAEINAVDDGDVAGFVTDFLSAISTLFPAASTTVAGKVELATTAETKTGTDTARAVTPAGLAGASLGAGQSWTDVDSSRVLGTTYTNSTGKPILVNVYMQSSASNASPELTIGGVKVYGPSQQNATYASSVSGLVPNDVTYSANVSTGTGTLIHWRELR